MSQINKLFDNCGQTNVSLKLLNIKKKYINGVYDKTF